MAVENIVAAISDQQVNTAGLLAQFDPWPVDSGGAQHVIDGLRGDRVTERGHFDRQRERAEPFYLF